MPSVYVQCRTQAFNLGSVVDGVYVSLHNVATGALISSGTSGAGGQPAGTVFLGDRDAATYELRITPPAGTVLQDASIQTATVVANIDPQYFDVLMDTSALPSALDERLCRCSGYFVDSFGNPATELTIRLSEKSLPSLLHYSGQDKTVGLIPKAGTVRTNSSGYAAVDLVRGHTYSVVLEGFTNSEWDVVAPDLSAAPLPDVLFPVVDSIQYTYNNALLDVDNPALSIVVGAEASVGVETVFRSGLRVGGLTAMSLESQDVDSQFVVVAYDAVGTLTITAGAVTAQPVIIEVSRVEPETGYGIGITPTPSVRGQLAITVIAA
jgi:hypothetical protein